MSTVFEASYTKLKKLEAKVERLAAERDRLRAALEEIVRGDTARSDREIARRALAEGTKE